MSTRATSPIAKTFTVLAHGYGYDSARLVQAPILDLLPDGLWPDDIERRAAACDDLIRRFAPHIKPEHYAAALAAALNLHDEYQLGTIRARLLAFRRRWHQEHPDEPLKIDLAKDKPTFDSTNQWWKHGKRRLTHALAHEIARRNRAGDWPNPSRESLARVAKPISRQVGDYPGDSEVSGLLREHPVAEARNETPPPPVPVRARPEYIHREKEEARFKQLVEEGSKLIVFLGLPGTGKTWLAEEVTRELMVSQVPFIRMSSGGFDTISDPQAAFVRLGIDPNKAICDDATALLAMLVSNPENAPGFVVLDNLRSADELRLLLPRQTESVIVATCRERGIAPPPGCRFIDVGKMDRLQAARLIKRRLPLVADVDAQQLALELHYHPLVINYACGLLQRHPRPVDEFCRDLGARLTRITRHVYTEDGQALLAVLSQTIKQVEERDPLAAVLLSLISCLRMLPFVSKHFLIAFRNVGQSTPGHSFLECEQALDVLRDFGLIDISESDITIHPFAQEVIRLKYLPGMILYAAHVAKIAKAIETYANEKAEGLADAGSDLAKMGIPLDSAGAAFTHALDFMTQLSLSATMCRLMDEFDPEACEYARKFVREHLLMMLEVMHENLMYERALCVIRAFCHYRKEWETDYEDCLAMAGAMLSATPPTPLSRSILQVP
jgi:hypothetical protein